MSLIDFRVAFNIFLLHVFGVNVHRVLGSRIPWHMEDLVLLAVVSINRTPSLPP